MDYKRDLMAKLPVGVYIMACENFGEPRLLYSNIHKEVIMELEGPCKCGGGDFPCAVKVVITESSEHPDPPSINPGNDVIWENHDAIYWANLVKWGNLVSGGPDYTPPPNWHSLPTLTINQSYFG